MLIEVKSVEETRAFGKTIGQLVKGGEVIELLGDVGAGKTTLVKGIAEGMGIHEPIQSPTFTINRLYENEKGIRLAHYDFYRLTDAGIMGDEITEMMADSTVVTIIEWAGAVASVLPNDRLTIIIVSPTEESRRFTLLASGTRSQQLVGALEQ